MVQMKNIAVVAGGNSGEFEVSLNSGRMVMESIDRNLFNPYYLVLKGTDWQAEVDGKFVPVDKDDFTAVTDRGKIRFDAVYLIIHGTPGEDGGMQGYFNVMGIPFVGPGIACCVLTMNKTLAKELVGAKGLPVAKGVNLAADSKPDWNALAAELGLPLFVKPNSGGSSVATHKVYKTEDLQAAFDDAAQHDTEILAEEFLQGTEISCGIYDDGERLVCLPITEIRPYNDFFDYRAKYMGESDEITPAPLDGALVKQINLYTQKAYRILHCNGMVRIDFIIRGGIPYFMEVNTIPGFSAASILPQQLRAAGLNITDVITRLIRKELK